MEKVAYLLGECDSDIAKVNTSENSFRPSFQHVFDENFPKNFMKTTVVVKGRKEERYLDLSSMRIYEYSEVVEMLENADLVIE